MTVSVYRTHAGTSLLAGEIDLVAEMARSHGRVTLLVASYAEGEVCRRNLADAGMGTGVDVLTPAAWLAGLWELLGDGRQLVDDLARRLLMAAVLAGEEARDAAALAPLKNNPGAVSMLCEMARDWYPDATADEVERILESRAEKRSAQVLEEYRAQLDARGMAEPACAARELVEQIGAAVPPCMRAVVVRGVTRLSEHALRLLEVVATAGILTFLYNEDQASLATEVAQRFGCTVLALEGDAPTAPASAFAEVCGPTARLASYAQLVADAVLRAPDESVAVACPDPIGLFRALAPRLAARGLAAQAEAFVRFPDTRAGQAFFQLLDFVDCMNTQEVSAWWPAPEIADWLRSPFSGVGPAARYSAVALDTQLRKNRTLTKASLMAQLDSIQSREQNRERDRVLEQGGEPHPVVLKDVIDAIDMRKYPRALRLMYEAALALGPLGFGSEGFAACQAELAALHSAYNVFTTAHELDIPRDAPLQALQSLSVRVVLASSGGAVRDAALAVTGGEDTPEQPSPTVPLVHFMRLDALAAHEAGEFGAVIWLDADAASYPLAERETVSSKFLARLSSSGLRLAAAHGQRDRVARALQVARRETVLAYVCNDSGAEERFPALTYAELKAACGSDGARLVAGLPGEGALFANLDPAGGRGMLVDKRPRHGEHVLPDELASYVLLRQRSINGRPVTRTLSASQVENYLACPYRWFVNSRVVTRRLDVEFGPIERGNFAHDVMQRFYERLAEAGLRRVTPDTIDECLAEMDLAFDEMRDDHLRGKYTHGKYAQEERPRAIRSGLVPLDEIERTRIEAMRAMFHEVVRHDATLLPLYAPANLEYSFDKEGVSYAGRPLGGRIDRIDVAPDAGSGARFAVIDYKTGASMDGMKFTDPTLALDDGAELPDTWLPMRDKDKAPKVQTLMYATALERIGAGQAQAAVYYGLRGPVVAGAVSSAITDIEEPQMPGAKVGSFPGSGGTKKQPLQGTMEFPDLLEQVERAISVELDRLEAGDIAPRPASDSCAFCPLTMCEKRR